MELPLNGFHVTNAERARTAFAPEHDLMALVACVQEEGRGACGGRPWRDGREAAQGAPDQRRSRSCSPGPAARAS